MPFLLCFSYRLYYQYIFIYFSASSSDKENSSIIFLITSSVNNSPFSFPADVADAGSRQPSSVDFTGPIYFTLSRNTEKPTAVPIITITAMMIQAGSSRFVGKIHALVKKKSTLPPINIPQPVIVRFPLESHLNLSMFHRIIFSRIASKSLTKCTGKTAWITESHHFCDLYHRILSTLHQRKAFVDTVFFQISGDSFACHFFEKAAASKVKDAAAFYFIFLLHWVWVRQP